MSSTDQRATAVAPDREERRAVQGAIESVGPREVLRLAAAQAPARLTMSSPTGSVVLWWTDGGVVADGDVTEAVAEVLAFTTGTFEIQDAEDLPGHPAVPFASLQAAAERLAAGWIEAAASVPNDGAQVRLVPRLGGPSVITGDQWRVLARVGAGRRVDELAELLALSARASMRVVADLVHAGLLEVVIPPTPLTVPPTGPAFPAPVPAPEVSAAEDADDDNTADDEDTAEPRAELVESEPAPEALPEAAWALEATLASSAVTWTPEQPTSDEAWFEPEPVHVTDEREWDASSVPVVASWDDHHAPVAAHAEWDPLPVVEGAAPPVGAAPGPIVEAAESEDASDDELVNRALLFKFLSSVRE